MSVNRSSGSVAIGVAITAALCFAAPAHAGSKLALLNFKSCAKPHYPKDSLAAKHEGEVTLAFLVDASGSVLDAKVEKSSGHVPLDTAARDALKLCKFAPAMKDGKAVQEWANVRYDWTLK